jgi:hypothetical protein
MIGLGGWRSMNDRRKQWMGMIITNMRIILSHVCKRVSDFGEGLQKKIH